MIVVQLPGLINPKMRKGLLMKTNTNKTLRLLVLAAMFAAMTTALTYFVKLPTPGGGYIHLGDSVIYLAACFCQPRMPCWPPE